MRNTLGRMPDKWTAANLVRRLNQSLQGCNWSQAKVVVYLDPFDWVRLHQDTTPEMIGRVAPDLIEIDGITFRPKSKEMP